MSSILIKGVKMPIDAPVIIKICPDGSVSRVHEGVVAKAVPVPPHGRLIDADALVRDNGIKEIPEYYEVVRDAPTIIPAEEGET